MDNQTGILTVFLVQEYKDIDGRLCAKRQVLMRERNVTQQQALGLFLDFRGMQSQELRGVLQSAWCCRVDLA